MILKDEKKWENFVQFCKNRGQYLGCFSCLSNLQDCPQCKKPLYKLNRDWHATGDGSVVFTGFTKHIRFRKYPTTWHNAGPIKSMMMLFVYSLYQHFAKIVYNYCFTFLLWGRHLLLLSYGIISWKILFLSFMLLIWLVNQISAFKEIIAFRFLSITHQMNASKHSHILWIWQFSNLLCYLNYLSLYW